MTDEPKGLKVAVIGSGSANMHMLAAMSGMPAGQAAILDPIPNPPGISGPHGKAWLCDVPEGLRRIGCDPAEDGTVCHWMVEAPEYHPAWHSYSIYCMHLRPLKKPRETKIYLDGATHEIWVYVIDPTGESPPADRHRHAGAPVADAAELCRAVH